MGWAGRDEMGIKGWRVMCGWSWISVQNEDMAWEKELYSVNSDGSTAVLEWIVFSYADLEIMP